MKAKRILYIATLAITLVSGCNKNYVPIGEHPFDITVPKIEARNAYMDVIPDNNDFCYICACVDTTLFSSFGSDENFVEQADKLLKATYRALYETESLEKFENYLYRGAYDLPCHNLSPNTSYWAFAYAYRDTTPVASSLTKVKFQTPQAKVSEITFSVALSGSLVTVTPSNNDQYFWDYTSTGDLDKYYYGRTDIFYSNVLDLYWEYGFLQEMLVKGEPSSDDISQFYDLTPGDKFYLVASGYDNGVSSDPETFLVTYNGADLPGTVEKVAKKEGATSMSSALSKCPKMNYSASKVSLKRLNR